MRIAYFGGTFDPPHHGHINLARQVLAGGWTDRVMFVPAFLPPHKRSDEISSFEHRLNMLKLMVAQNNKFEVSDIEADIAVRPSYTSAVLELLSQRFPQDRLQLLIGEDSLRQLHTWYDARQLVSNHELLIYPRGPKQRVTRAELLQHWNGEEADILLNSLLQMPFFDLSSSEIRKKVAKRENFAKMVSEDVIKYINYHGLYRDKEKQ